ncbi:hypothetical protein EC991_000852 [Linnemannia zychae]|nr:hypothetical protein EC991_000852 [Linnemannia zychae]
MTFDSITAPQHNLARSASLGWLCALPDSVTIESILTLLGPKDLLSLALTSRYLSAFARNDYVWKRLFFNHRNRGSTRIVFRGSWFLTYLFPTPDHDKACSNHPLVKHPVPVQGVTSPYLSQQWYRGHLFLGHFYPPPPQPPTPVPRGHHSSHRSFALENYDVLDIETFNRRYRYPNRPLMIQHSGVEQWPAWEQWTLDALASKYGETQFRVSNIESDEEPSFGMYFKDFLHYIRFNSDTDPLYLFDPYFAEAGPEMDSAYKVPKYFEFDYFSLLEGDARPPFRWLLVGPQRTGAPWHVDPSGTSAWNTLLSGHKRWALYPPHTIPPGHDPTSSERKTSVSWYLDVYPYLPPESLPLEIVQNPGQTIYVPSGWWHMVINMDDTVAVTHNFADEANLLQVKRSLLSDDKETTQLKRWELLEKEICSRRPDLVPALTYRSEHQLIPGLIDKGPWFDVESPESLNTWQSRTLQVLQRTGMVCALDDIEPVLSGRNICFVTEQAFVKFFTPYQDGLPCFLSEVAANQLIMDDDHKVYQRQSALSSPKMLGHGFFLELDNASTAEEMSEWRWPYIITETASDMPLFDALDFLPLQQIDEGFLAPLMEGLQYYHTLDLDTHTIPLEVVNNSSTAIPTRLHSAALNHARWRLFPKHLLDTLPAYLPTNHLQVFNPSLHEVPGSGSGSGRDVSASVVHGDVNPSNILGVLSSPSFGSSYSNGQESPYLFDQPPAQAEFKPTTMIDFGDVLVNSDPLIDYVSVFITILNSRRDQAVIDVLLNSWRKFLSKHPSSSSHAQPQLQQNGVTGADDISLAKRCMWHVLLWPSEGLALHLTQCVPEIGEMNTWHEVERALFGWWSAL